MREMTKVFIVYVVGMVSIIACMSSIVVIPTIVRRFTRPKVHEVTSSLDAAVVQDLCQKLALPEDDPLCQPGAVVYAPDFFPAVRASFQPGVTTYEDVQERLGDYQYKRGQLITQADGATYFVCDYDFNSDRVFPVGFFSQRKAFWSGYSLLSAMTSTRPPSTLQDSGKMLQSDCTFTTPATTTRTWAASSARIRWCPTPAIRRT